MCPLTLYINSPLGPIIVAHMCLVWGQLLGVWATYRWSHLQGLSGSPFPRWLVPMTSWQGWDHMGPSPTPCWNFGCHDFVGDYSCCEIMCGMVISCVGDSLPQPSSSVFFLPPHLCVHWTSGSTRLIQTCYLWLSIRSLILSMWAVTSKRMAQVESSISGFKGKYLECSLTMGTFNRKATVGSVLGLRLLNHGLLTRIAV